MVDLTPQESGLCCQSTNNAVPPGIEIAELLEAFDLDSDATELSPVGCVKWAALTMLTGPLAKPFQLAEESHESNRPRNTPGAARLVGYGKSQAEFDELRLRGKCKVVCFVVVASSM
jgi:hypothetical protein